MHQKKILLTYSCIRAGFFRIKVASDFHFEHSKNFLIEWLRKQLDLFWTSRSHTIFNFNFFHSLLGLVSYTHGLFNGRSMKTKLYFHPAVDREMHQQVLWKSWTRELPHVEKTFSNGAINKLVNFPCKTENSWNQCWKWLYKPSIGCSSFNSYPKMRLVYVFLSKSIIDTVLPCVWIWRHQVNCRLAWHIEGRIA